MPIYDYECNSCGKKFSKLVLASTPEDSIVCSRCDSNDVRKLISGFATVSNNDCGYHVNESPAGGCSEGG